MAKHTEGGGVRRAAHRAIDRTISALTPSDGATPFRPASLEGDPEELFHIDDQPPRIMLEKVRRVGFVGPETLRKRFAFESPLRSGVADNDTVRGLWLSPLERSHRGSLVFLHAWKAAGPWRLQKVGRRAIQEGFEVFLPAHPYHAWRKPKMTSSGILMLSADLDRTAKAVQQAVLDARSLLRWVQERDQGPVILAGVGLGGLIAALVATVHDDLDGLVLIAAPDRLSQLLWSGLADKGRFREVVERAGIGRDDLDQTWATLDPGWRPPKLAPERVLLVDGRYDHEENSRSHLKLAERWGVDDLRTSTHGFTRADFPLFAKPIIREAIDLIDKSRL